MNPRSSVYAAIDGERDYQESIGIESQMPSGYLLAIEKLLDDAKYEDYHGNADGVQDHLRKIAAVAVAAMEEHGVVRRSAI